MAIISVDTETYQLYDGTKECEEEIQNAQPYQKIPKLTKGELYPVLNAQKYTIGTTAEYINGKLDIRAFTQPQALVNYLETRIAQEHKKQQITYIYAHNHNYDFTSYYQLHKCKKPEDIKIIHVTPTFLAIKIEKQQQYEDFAPANQIKTKTKAIAYYLDTTTLYPESLKKAGQKINIPKQEMPKEIHNKYELIKYCANDTLIVLALVYNMKHLLGQIGIKTRRIITAGQIAISAYKQYAKENQLDNELLQWENHKPTGRYIPCQNDELIRKAYRGGRNEAYQTGKYKNVARIDKNSIYPKALSEIPTPVSETERTIKDEDLLTAMWNKKLLQQYMGVCKAQVTAPPAQAMKNGLMYLPVKYKEDTYYPQNTQITAVWTILELERAQELGYKINKILEATTYQKSKKPNIFKTWIQHMYNQRIKHPEYSTTIKLIMNNLPAKFAQKRNQTQTQIIQRQQLPEYQEQGYAVQGMIQDYYVVEKQLEEKQTTHYQPIISAYTTAHARDMMYEDLKKIPQKQLLYTDTDSIVYIETKDTQIENLFKISQELGDWKIQNRHDNADIRGRKQYTIGNTQVMSGVNKEIKIREGQPITVIRMNNYNERTTQDKIGTFTKVEYTPQEIHVELPKIIEEE